MVNPMTARITPATVRAHHSLTPEAIEQGAKALAVALNGGDWDRDYTDDQKALWRQRVVVAMGGAQFGG